MGSSMAIWNGLAAPPPALLLSVTRSASPGHSCRSNETFNGYDIHIIGSWNKRFFILWNPRWNFFSFKLIVGSSHLSSKASHWLR